VLRSHVSRFLGTHGVNCCCGLRAACLPTPACAVPANCMLICSRHVRAWSLLQVPFSWPHSIEEGCDNYVLGSDHPACCGLLDTGLDRSDSSRTGAGAILAAGAEVSASRMHAIYGVMAHQGASWAEIGAVMADTGGGGTH
jgi:hypothetical protein